MTHHRPRYAALAACLGLLLAASPSALAQKAAEQYIPLGQSPGLSGQYTLLGVIRAVDAASGTVLLDLEEAGQARTVVTPRTRVWVDRGLLRQANRRGDLDDLVPGRWLEAMPDPANPDQAEWVKVEVEAEGGAGEP